MSSVHTMRCIINSECSKCCPLALTKACLLHWSIALLTMVCSKSDQTFTSRCFWAISRTGFFYPQVMYSTVLRCRLIGGHKSSEMKLSVSRHRNLTVEVHGGPVQHRHTGLLVTCLVTTYTKRKLFTSDDTDIRAIWSSYVEKWRVFPKKPDCQICLVNWRAVLQWCCGCYSNYAGSSLPIPNFSG